jgi:RNA polymerase sigma-70 factor, ECF subfamily
MVLARRSPLAGVDLEIERVRRAQSGDPAAFAELVQQHQGMVERLVLGFVRDVDDARDVAQEAWIKAARALPQLRDIARFRPWLCSIARNSSLSFISARKARAWATPLPEDLEPPDHQGETPESHLLALDERRRVWQALGDLSERDREALFLRESQGLHYVEIAERLGVSRSAAEVCVFRARQRFRRRYRENEAYEAGCGVGPIELGALLEGEVPAEQRIGLEAHVQGCKPCSTRLRSMAAGRSLYRQMGGFLLPFGAPGLLTRLQGLFAKVTSLFGSGSAAPAATAAGATGVAAAASAGGLLSSPVPLELPARLLGVALALAAVASPASPIAGASLAPGAGTGHAPPAAASAAAIERGPSAPLVAAAREPGPPAVTPAAATRAAGDGPSTPPPTSNAAAAPPVAVTANSGPPAHAAAPAHAGPPAHASAAHHRAPAEPGPPAHAAGAASADRPGSGPPAHAAAAGHRPPDAGPPAQAAALVAVEVLAVVAESAAHASPGTGSPHDEPPGQAKKSGDEAPPGQSKGNKSGGLPV